MQSRMPNDLDNRAPVQDSTASGLDAALKARLRGEPRTSCASSRPIAPACRRRRWRRDAGPAPRSRPSGRLTGGQSRGLLKYVAIAVVAWLLLSLVLFIISAADRDRQGAELGEGGAQLGRQHADLDRHRADHRHRPATEGHARGGREHERRRQPVGHADAVADRRRRRRAGCRSRATRSCRSRGTARTRSTPRTRSAARRSRSRPSRRSPGESRSTT